MKLEKAATRRHKALRVATVAGVAAAGVLAAASPSWAAVDALTLSATSGPTGGGNTVTVTAGSPTNDYTAQTNYVEFQMEPASGGTGCGTTYVTPVAVSTNTSGEVAVPSANVRVLTTSKLAVQVPSGVVLGTGNTGTAKWDICVYSSMTGTSLISGTATAAYTIGTIPTITSVTPSTGSTQGGGTMTILGTGFTGAAVQFAGAAVVSPVITGDTKITFPIPSHAAGGPHSVMVTYPNGGTATMQGFFTYTNGITVTPNTVSNSKAKVDLDITGSGFTYMNFTTSNGQTPEDTNAHVYLVRGNYDPTKNTAGMKTIPHTAECMNVLVISNTELTCSVYPAGGGVALASHTVTGTASGNALTASTGTFTLGDVGAAISGPTALGTGTYITGMTDSTHATLSKTLTTAITAATTFTIGATRTFADATLTASSPTITSTSGAQFSTADIGRMISGTGIPANATITAVASATSATLSANATATASGTYTIGYNSLVPAIPSNAYTVTVVNDGGIDVQAGGTKADALYTKTVVSSGSTFTVADY